MTSKLPAFLCGVMAGLFAIAFERQVSTQQPTGGVDACVSADGTLRMTPSAVPCAPGERRMRLAAPKIEQKVDCQEDDRRLVSLQRRLSDLEFRDRRGTRRGRRAVAPFEVVTRGGTRLLYVEEQNVTFYNADGKPVVWVLADGTGGFLTAQTVDGQNSIGVGALDRRAHVRIQEKGHDRIDLGRRVDGRVGLLTYGAPDKVVAFIGQSLVGSGLAVVADAGGVFSARAVADEAAGGRVVVVNPQDVDVAALATGEGGAGRLQLTDASGTVMVEAGLMGGVGMVGAGPGIRHSGVGIVGLTPSYIVGRPRR